MNITDYKGEDALELLADLLDPVSEIFADAEFRAVMSSGKPPINVVKMLLKAHKKSIIEIFALIDGVPVEEYKVNVFTLPLKLIDLLNNEEFMMLFQSQGQKMQAESFGSAMASTEENGR